ncbi:MAG TPA: hypothetical protein VJY33_12370 [Isosphaeraceae bacterium]|nr:hypothetical protein [Isosphaeraceae bacterium]
MRHLFPELNTWIDQIPDPRFAPLVVYHKRFLVWWGLSLFLCKLSSRRQLDYQLNTDGPEVLANLNRLAGTAQDSRPVNRTLEYFLGKTGAGPIAGLRRRMVQRLIRMKALDAARLLGRFVVLIDGSGYLVFGHRHCADCLTQRHGETTLYMHQVLEAKLLGPAGTVVSIATEFIDNSDAQSAAAGASQEHVKQDCELKALRRLLATLRAEFPQMRICLGGDGLYACGEGFQVAKDYKCDYIYTFQPGRLPALWEDFQGLLHLDPEEQVVWATPQGVVQVYHWVNALDYTDSDGRAWTVNALACTETNKEGNQTEWSWLTSLDLSHQTVAAVATQGGRERWREENEGFNTQKNSGLNLEHAYSHTCWAAYYFLLQIAHLLLQLVEKGSLLRHLAWEQGKRTAVELFGSLKNMAQRLLESLRYRRWPDEAFDRVGAGGIQIRLDSS